MGKKKKKKKNLTREQRKALKEIKENNLVDIYLFDKGNGFVRIEHDKALEKICEQIGPTRVLSEDPTSSYAVKIKTFPNLIKNNVFQKLSTIVYIQVIAFHLVCMV